MTILYWLVNKILKKYHPDVIGVVGDSLIEPTKEAVAAVLGGKFKIQKNAGGQKHDLDILLTLLGSDDKTVSFFKIMARIIKLLLKKDVDYPEIIIITIKNETVGKLNLLMKYVSFGLVLFLDAESVLTGNTAKKQLTNNYEIFAKYLTEHGVVVVNIDDRFFNTIKFRSKKITIGFDEAAEIRASDEIISLNNNEADSTSVVGLNFKLIYQGNVVPILLPGTLDSSHIYGALASVACGLVFQMNLTDIANNLKNYQAAAGCLRLIKGIKNTLLIDNTAQLSLSAIKKSLDSLALIPLVAKAESYFVFGDLVDFGNQTEDIHREVGHYFAEKGINKLITVGERSHDVALAAREAGVEEDKIFSFPFVEEAGRFIQDRLEENDIVLISGSKAIAMEKIVKELMAEPLKAEQLLITSRS